MLFILAIQQEQNGNLKKTYGRKLKYIYYPYMGEKPKPSW